MLIHSFFIFIFALLLHVTTPQTSRTIKLNDTKSITLQPSKTAYYNLEIPNDIQPHTKYLLVKVSPNEKQDRKENLYSDPNLYVSTTNKFPNRQNNSEWHSFRFGDEIITIDKQYVKPGNRFYFGVHCDKKCNFIFKVKLLDEYEITSNTLYGVTLKQDESMKIKFKTPKHYNEFTLSCIALTLEPFRMYVSTSNPSSSNTLNTNPIYTNGYRTTVVKGTDEYMVDTTYEVLLHNIGEGSNKLKLWLKYDNKELVLKPYEDFFENAKRFADTCFKYQVLEKDRNKDIIIVIMLYSGSGYVHIGGWKSIVNMTYDTIPFNENTYEIESDVVIKLNKTNFDTFNNDNDGSSSNGDDEYLHLCFFASEQASFTIKMYYLESTEQTQKLNYLLPGSSITNYLPKNQITRYHLQYLTNTNTTFSIKIETLKGLPQLYIVFCDENDCHIDSSRLTAEIDKATRIIHSHFLAPGVNQVTLDASNNMCINMNELSSCAAMAVIQCNSTLSECVYKISYIKQGSEITLQPRTPYYNIIRDKESEEYSLLITDPNVNNFAVVLNQHTGNTQMSLMKYITQKESQLLSENKMNHQYLPNLITVSKKDLRTKHIEGKYIIKVTSNSFSSYSLYYYTFDDDVSSSIGQLNISMKLSKGKMIEDFFPTNSSIKIYVYTHNIEDEKDKTDIYITLTRFNLYCDIYVFGDLDNVEYNSSGSGNEKVSGYLWKSDYTHSITISKDDPNYIYNAELYIVVVKNEEMSSYVSNNNNIKPITTSFLIGITDESTPFLINEGKETRLTLTNTYTQQNFFYFHSNKNDSLSISFNIFYGSITATISTAVNTALLYNSTITNSKFLSFDPHDICTNSVYCGIYINITKSSYTNSQFLLVIKSQQSTHIQLSPGTPRTYEILTGETQHYLIQAIPQEHIGIRISARFTSGMGNIYVNKLTPNQTIVNSLWPNETAFHYEGKQSIIYTKSINIPYDDIKELYPCVLLITILGKDPGYDNNKIQYTISYTSGFVFLHTNKRYQFDIGSGEVQLYRFEHKGRNNNLYISMSNKEGDADMYLNYGNVFPTMDAYTWKSKGAYTELLELSLNDPNFSSLGVSTIEGEYSLMIHGYSNTLYTLYISSNEKKIITLNDDNSQESCTCQQANDVCYFRYENINNFGIKEVMNKEVIFTIDYTYGNGIAFGKLYKDGNTNTIIKDLPSKKNYDYANDKRQNYIKVNLSKDNPKYTLDSVVVVGVHCTEKSLLDVNAVKLKVDDYDCDDGSSSSKYEYLQTSKENVFYISSNTMNRIVKYNYYIYKEQDLNFELKVYSGEAKVLIYTNKTNYNSSTHNVSFEYNHVADFSIKEGYSNSYSNSINKHIGYKSFVYFAVEAVTNCVFYIKIDYDSEWTRVPIGKLSKYTMMNHQFNGYFDMLEEFEEIILSVTTETPQTRMKVYTKLNVLGQNDVDENQTYIYSVPSENNYDNKGESNELLSSISFKIKNIPKNKRQHGNSGSNGVDSKLVRLLFTVDSHSYTYNNRYSYRYPSSVQNKKEEQIFIMVSPNVNHYKRIRSEQGLYHFSSVKANNKEKLVYNMIKKNNNDDLLIIEISSCQGQFDYAVTNGINTNADIEYSKLQTISTSSNGKRTIKVPNITNNDYYLSVWGIEDDSYYCIVHPNLTNCTKDAEFMVYYYTTTEQKYKHNVLSNVFTYEHIDKGQIAITLPKLYQKDSFGNTYNVDTIQRRLILSTKAEDFEYMESICYLNKMYQSMTKSKEFKYISTEYNRQRNVLNVKGLLRNQIYYVNVLLSNSLNGEIIALKPFIVSSNYTYLSWVVIGAAFGVIGVLSVLVGVFYHKFKQTKMVLKYEKNDLRSMGSIPKSVTELQKMEKEIQKSKYANLADESQNI